MIPDYQTLMLPVLKACSGGGVLVRDVIAKLAIKYELTKEERGKLLSSGRQTTFSNRIHWAKTYLKQAGLICYSVRKSHD